MAESCRGGLFPTTACPHKNPSGDNIGRCVFLKQNNNAIIQNKTLNRASSGGQMGIHSDTEILIKRTIII